MLSCQWAGGHPAISSPVFTRFPSCFFTIVPTDVFEIVVQFVPCKNEVKLPQEASSARSLGASTSDCLASFAPSAAQSTPLESGVQPISGDVLCVAAALSSLITLSIMLQCARKLVHTCRPYIRRCVPIYKGNRRLML
ncbi:hypothetical protein C2E23DRAFT_813322 [Lenzites betulinus]|nr:hypothetical protein C2E23DRAFT_813322 [Lenzites betulinus]